MSMACWATPRKKFPPPTTIPIWTAEGVDVGDFFCDLVDEDGVDAEAGACGQGFA